MEELEAVDWYRQRADDCDDEALRDILLHNMREEMEHASMVLEWIRRNAVDFGIPLITNLQLAKRLVEALAAKAPSELQIKSWNEYEFH